MQQYLRRNRLNAWMDALGLRAAVMLAAQVWFVLLWGLGVPSVTAGLALGLLGQLAISRYRCEHATAREASLRRRLGGELLLEEMTLTPREQADAKAVTLLAQAYPELCLRTQTPDGCLCDYAGETLLVACCAKPADCELSAADAAAFARAVKLHKADRGVLCATCKCAASAMRYAEEAPVRVRLIDRAQLLQLAGEASPATDAQLVALGARRKRLTPTAILRGALRRAKARRYMTYGLGLSILYVATGLRYYPAPGLLCMVLAAACRCVQEGRERL